MNPANSGFFVNPISSSGTGANQLFYNTSTSEIFYSIPSSVGLRTVILNATGTSNSTYSGSNAIFSSLNSALTLGTSVIDVTLIAGGGSGGPALNYSSFPLSGGGGSSGNYLRCTVSGISQTNFSTNFSFTVGGGGAQPTDYTIANSGPFTVPALGNNGNN